MRTPVGLSQVMKDVAEIPGVTTAAANGAALMSIGLDALEAELARGRDFSHDAWSRILRDIDNRLDRLRIAAGF